jgi:hypothetical protein
MPLPKLPPLPRHLSDLEEWSENTGVADLLDRHVSEICDLVESAVVRSRLAMAPVAATLREVVIKRNTTRAFLTHDVLPVLGSAACGYLLFHAQSRALATWRDRHWRLPLAGSGLPELAERLKAALEQCETDDSLLPLARLTDARSKILEDPDRFEVVFEDVGRHLWSPPVTCAIGIEPVGDDVSWSCTCNDPPSGAPQPCGHLRMSLGWLLDAIYDPQHPHQGELLLALGTPRWQRLLDAIDRAAPTSEAEPETDERLVWKLATDSGLLDIEPSIQKLTKRGVWSRGRRVDGSEIWRCFDDADAEQRRLLRAYMEVESAPYGDYGDVGRVLELLVGHPLVFDADSPTRRIDVVAEPPAVCLRVASGGGLELGVPMHGRVLIGQDIEDALVSWPHLVCLDSDRGLCSVMTLPSECEHLMETLSRFSGVKIPASSLDRALEVVSKYGEWLTVDVDSALEVVRRPA